MTKNILTVIILLVIVLGVSGCMDDIKEEKKIEKKLLKGSPDESNYQLSQKYFEEANYKEALKYDLKQLEEDLKYYKEQSAEVSLDYNNIGLDYSKLKEYDNALNYYNKALKIDNIVFDKNSTERATTYYNIGAIYDKLNDYNTSLRFYKKALNIDKDEDNILSSYKDIARVYRTLKNYSFALKYYKQALRLELKLLEKDDEEIFETQQAIAELKKKLL